MSFVSPTTPANHVQGASPSTSSNSNPSWNGIGGGPQAISYAAIMQIMAMMNEIMKNYSEQARLQATINQTLATSARQETIDAGNAQRNSLICEAVGAGVAAGAGAVSLGYKGLVTDKGLSASIKENDTTKKQLQNLSTAFDKTPKATLGAGEAQDSSSGVAPSRDDIGKLHSKNGILEAAKIVQVDKDGNAVNSHAETKTITDAFAHMSDNERAEFRSQLRSAMDENSRDLNNIYTSNQSRSQSVQMVEGMFNNATTAATKGASSKFTADASTSQGDSTLQNSIAQQAASNTANINGELGKAYDKEMQALQMLSTLSQANRA
jgi:hypothetical protein